MERQGKPKYSRAGPAEEGNSHVTKNQGDGGGKHDGSTKTIPRAYANGCTTNNIDYYILRSRDSQRKSKAQNRNSQFKEAASGQGVSSGIDRR